MRIHRLMPLVRLRLGCRIAPVKTVTVGATAPEVEAKDSR